MRSSPTLRAALLALALSGTLAVPPAAGAALPGSVVSVPATALGAFDWVSRTWSWLRGVWPEAGRVLDPSGHRATSAPVRPQDGLGIDPNGGRPSRAPRLRPDESCGLDPNGHCGGMSPIRPTVPRG
jgi:hypothetical protein